MGAASKCRRPEPRWLAGGLVALLVALAVCGCERDEQRAGGGSVASAAPSVDMTSSSAGRGTSAPGTGASAGPASAASGDLPQSVDDEPVDVHAESCASAQPSLAPMQLLRFTFTDGIEGRDPRSRLAVARPGKRLYVHLTMRNRSGRERCVRVTFRAAGHKRSEVTLTVGKSWSWRTWAYATLRPDDHGPLVVEVRDDQGALVTKRTIGVAPPG